MFDQDICSFVLLIFRFEVQVDCVTILYTRQILFMLSSFDYPVYASDPYREFEKTE